MSENTEVKPDESTINLVEKKNGLDDLIGSMPEVVPDAVQASKDKENANKSTLDSFLDKFGNKFDSSLHDVDENGNPKLTPTGRLKYKAGARFRKSADSILKTAAVDTPKDPEKERIQAAAVQFADSFLMGGRMIVGDEWNDQPGERDSLIDANYRVFERYGVVEIHPIANMGLCYGLFIFKRVVKPESKSQKIWRAFCAKVHQRWVWASDWVRVNIFKQKRVYENPKKEERHAESPKTVSP